MSNTLASQGELYLASGSPRRRELLSQLIPEFAVVHVDVDESRLPQESPANMVVRLACLKAGRGREIIGVDAPVLAADTVVAMGDDVFGKPESRADALAMLARLSGATHEVFTGVALEFAGNPLTRLSVTRVSFRDIDLAEAEAYWASGEPADKAGAYAIQGIGGIFVRNLEGSYSGVVGLPVFETAELLRQSGFKLLSPANG